MKSGEGKFPLGTCVFTERQVHRPQQNQFPDPKGETGVEQWHGGTPAAWAELEEDGVAGGQRVPVELRVERLRLQGARSAIPIIGHYRIYGARRGRGEGGGRRLRRYVRVQKQMSEKTQPTGALIGCVDGFT